MTGHLIHIGLPKAGSHFLRRWFGEHPQLLYVEGGIAGFRDVYDLSRQSAEPAPGLRYRVTSSEALVTPNPYIGRPFIDYRKLGYADIPGARAEACATLAALFPDAHVLLVTRGFRSVVLSTYSQLARTGDERDFDAWTATVLDHDAGRYFWDYDGLIDLYGGAFGGRLIVMPWELMRDDVEAFIASLEQRLGLASHPPSGARDNESLSPAELLWYPRLTRLVRRLPVGDRLRTMLLRRYLPLIRDGRLRGLSARLQRLRPLPPISADRIDDDLDCLFRGTAERLREYPLYADYADDYLL